MFTFKSVMSMIFLLVISRFIYPLESGYAYIGCYKDTNTNALDDQNLGNGYIIHTCFIACASYTYFALQDDDKCFCENTYAQAIQYGVSTQCIYGLGAANVNALYVNCNTALSVCASSTVENTLVTDAYGGSGGTWYDLLNQGRVYSIQGWGYHPDHDGLHIKDWYADDQTENHVYGTASSHSSCTAFTLDNDDFITGYKVWLHPDRQRPGRLELKTRNGNTYTCGYPDFDLGTASAVYENSFNYAQYDFWYLTGWHIKGGANIGYLGFQFTRSTMTVPPTSKPTPSPTDRHTHFPTSLPTKKPTNEPANNPTINPTPTLLATTHPTDNPTNVPTKKPRVNPTISPSIAIKETNDVSKTDGEVHVKDGDISSWAQLSLQIRIMIFVVGGLIVCGIICGVLLLCYLCNKKKKEPEQIEGEMMQMTTTVVESDSDESELNVEQAEVISWIKNTVQLAQYTNTFLDQGFDSMEAIKCIKNTQDLLALGIQSHGHRTLILEEIETIRNTDSKMAMRPGHTGNGEGSGSDGESGFRDIHAQEATSEIADQNAVGLLLQQTPK
eukprot:337739_1